MEITLTGTEEELRVADDMLDRVALAASGSDVVIRMSVYRPDEIVADDKAPETAPTLSPRTTLLQQVFGAMGEKAEGYLMCLYDAGLSGMTQAAVMRRLGVQKIGPVRGAVKSVAKTHGLTMDDLIEVTVRRGQNRYALTREFGEVVHERPL